MTEAGQSASAIRRNRRFYDRWRHPYDLFTKRMLPLTGPRAEAANALAVADGHRVVECGCGTGANVPHVARAMASHDDCRYVGIDIAPHTLRRARAMADRHGWSDVSFVVGDATAPPVGSGVDAILSSFVVTIFSDPGAIAKQWLDLLRPGGRLVLLNTHPSDRPRGRLLNPAYNLFVAVANPIDPRSIRRNPPWKLLRQRVNAVEHAVEAHATSYTRREFYGGLLSLIVATA